MTDTIQHFIPLNSDSQGDSENVLFYNKEASLEAIYNCATGRIQAVINLAVNLYEYQESDPSMLKAISVVTALLLNDAYSLLDEFTSQAVRARFERGEVYLAFN